MLAVVFVHMDGGADAASATESSDTAQTARTEAGIAQQLAASGSSRRAAAG
jgi:hypothetical protein